MKSPSISRACRVSLLVAISWLTACAPPPAPPSKSQPAPPIDQALHTTPPAAPLPAALTRIEDASEICMLSSRYLGTHKQVPTIVDDKTYYGCCAGCAARLGANPAARSAIDPVSHHAVDKASAILARGANNTVLYFESEQTFARYAATP